MSNDFKGDLAELDSRMDLFEMLVPFDHPFGIWVKDYTDWYAKTHSLKIDTAEDASKLSRFMKAKILGGVSLQRISLIDMGRTVFATYQQHKSFVNWLSPQVYNPDIQDNTQEIIDNELANRKWYEERTGIKFEGSADNVCSAKD